MKCPNCNSDNFEYEKFCHICGTKLEKTNLSQNTDDSRKKFTKKDIIARLLLIFLFIAVFLGYQLRFLGQFIK